MGEKKANRVYKQDGVAVSSTEPAPKGTRYVPADGPGEVERLKARIDELKRQMNDHARTCDTWAKQADLGADRCDLESVADTFRSLATELRWQPSLSAARRGEKQERELEDIIKVADLQALVDKLASLLRCWLEAETKQALGMEISECEAGAIERGREAAELWTKESE